jgi:IclR family acetate operon transcriptional repressor
METPVSRVQSIERAFAVLGALGDGPLGVTGVADRVRLPKSTVARLLAALASEGAVEQVPDGTDYRIGSRLVTLAAGVRQTRSLIALARPHLVDLAGVIGEAAGLSSWST